MRHHYPLQLNLGSGRNFREDYLNIDIRDDWAPDIVVDLNLPFPHTDQQTFQTHRFGTISIAKNTFKKITAHDVLEHIQNLVVFMKSCLDLLEVGGEFDILVPYDLSYGAWQDPTHVHAFNEKSWLYYTEWFWYLRWTEARFELDELHFELNSIGQKLIDQGTPQEEVLRFPRAVDSMRVKLRKILLSQQDQQTLAQYLPKNHIRQYPPLKFAVSIISPPNYLHSEAFREVAETIHYALLELGYDTVLSSKIDFSDRQHIILGANLLPSMTTLPPKGSILYNLEQVDLQSPWFQPAMLEFYKNYPLWDCSVKNIEQFHRLGIENVQHVPIGYVSQLTRISQSEEQDIDVLFYGSMNQRRQHIIDSLKLHGVNVLAVFGKYGPERDILIARSKIILNVHFYQTKIFETVRTSYLLANRCFVISEKGNDPKEEAEFSRGIVFSDYHNLVQTCLDYLNRPGERKHIAETGFQFIRQRSQSEYLKTILKKISVERF